MNLASKTMSPPRRSAALIAAIALCSVPAAALALQDAEGGIGGVLTQADAQLSDAPDSEAVAAHDTFNHVSCGQTGVEVRLTVDGVKESIGLMTAELYRNDKANFLQSKGRVSKTRFAAKSPSTQFCIEVPEPGQYAVVVYHDENANLRIDKGAFGIPNEPWAISNDPPIRFGPPSVEDSLVTVTDTGADVTVVLND